MSDLASQITQLKAEFGKNLAILGHHYQRDEIIAHCDYVGDSLELARKIEQIDSEHIVFCGVLFMAETAALLAKPSQKVYLPASEANCAMSLMAPADKVAKVLNDLKKTARKIIPVVYVNSSLALKAVVGEHGGIVCTSANAAKILQWALDNSDSVFFLPDANLGRNMARAVGLTEADCHLLEVTEQGLSEKEQSTNLTKKILLWPGNCPIHDALTEAQIESMRAKYKDCKVAVHPESRAEIVKASDLSGSTSFLIKEAEKFAKTGQTLIIGTEISLVNRLAKKFQGQTQILPLSDLAICDDMGYTTEAKLLACLESIKNNKAEIISLEKALCPPAKLSLERMLDASR